MNCWNPKFNQDGQLTRETALVSLLLLDMGISSQAEWRHSEGSTTRVSRLMTQRKHDSYVVCMGCGRKYGIIQQAHIVKCEALHEMGITSRKEYKERFGSTMSDDALFSSIKNIQDRNQSLTPEERKIQARKAWEVLAERDPEVFSKAGKAGAAALWSNENQKIRHKNRIYTLLDKALKREPNKVEEFFWDYIGKDLIDFCSFDVWYEFAGIQPHVHNRMPDFVVRGQKKVIDIFGERAHCSSEVSDRIRYWNDEGYSAIVVWYGDIKKITKREQTRERVLKFISGKLHEREAPNSIVRVMI